MPKFVVARSPTFKQVTVHTAAPRVTFAYFPLFELVVVDSPPGTGIFGYYVELRDKTFKKVRILNPEIEALEWQYNRIGGCGGFSLTLKTKFDALRDVAVSGDFDVQVYLPSPDGLTTVLWYRGYVDRVDEMMDTKETVRFSGYGYGRQLNRVVVAATYANMEISAIVRDILDLYVAPKTSILATSGLFNVTGYTASTLVFNTTADKAIKTLADLVGYEFGVNKERQFFFVPPGVTITNRHFIGGDILKHDSPREYDGIVNKVFVQGKDGLRFTVENTESQDTYGIREEIVVNASITNAADAQQFGVAFLRERAKPVRRTTINVRNMREPVERNLPIGRVAISGEASNLSVLYGVPLYGQAIYGGAFQAQPETIRYTFRDGLPDVVYQLGNPKDESSKQLKSIEYELDALREV